MMTTVCFMCMVLLNSHRIHSFLHSSLWKSSQLAPLCVQGSAEPRCVVCSGLYSCKCGWLLMVSVGLALVKRNFWCQFEISAFWRPEGLSPPLTITKILGDFLNSISEILNWLFRDLVNRNDCPFSTCEFRCIKGSFLGELWSRFWGRGPCLQNTAALQGWFRKMGISALKSPHVCANSD